VSGQAPLQGVAQAGEAVLDVHQFAEHRPGQHRRQHQGELVGGQDLAHAEGSGEQAQRAHDRLAEAFREPLADQRSHRGAGDHSGGLIVPTNIAGMLGAGCSGRWRLARSGAPSVAAAPTGDPSPGAAQE
jgi:hypothetical protein